MTNIENCTAPHTGHPNGCNKPAAFITYGPTGRRRPACGTAAAEALQTDQLVVWAPWTPAALTTRAPIPA